MSDKPWHEDDEFWRIIEPVLFPRARLESAADEIDHVLFLLGLEPGARVLDMCCGVGRHTLELARRGFRVTAVDRTRLYLDRARAQAEAEGLSIEFIEDDMRRFVRPAAFDGAINFFTSFGFFESDAEERAAASNLAESLRPGRSLVMDLMGKEIIARVFQERQWREIEGVHLLEERSVIRSWSAIANRWIVIGPDDSRREVQLTLRVYSAAELSRLLLESGFSSTKAFGSMDGKPYDTHADRLVMVARR